MVEKDGLSCIVILSDGQWGLGAHSGRGGLCHRGPRPTGQDPDDADQYYARSSAFDDVTYDMHTTAERISSGGAGKMTPTCARRTASKRALPPCVHTD